MLYYNKIELERVTMLYSITYHYPVIVLSKIPVKSVKYDRNGKNRAANDKRP